MQKQGYVKQTLCDQQSACWWIADRFGHVEVQIFQISGHCREAGLVSPCALGIFSAWRISKTPCNAKKLLCCGVGEEQSGRGSNDAHIKVYLRLESSSSCNFRSPVAWKLTQRFQQLAQQLVVRLCLKFQSFQVPRHLTNGLCKHSKLTSATFQVMLNTATSKVYCEWTRMPPGRYHCQCWALPILQEITSKLVAGNGGILN